jgi:hypothetical protein
MNEPTPPPPPDLRTPRSQRAASHSASGGGGSYGIDQSALRAQLAELWSIQGLMLLICVLWRPLTASVSPATGLDNSWFVGLNLGRDQHLQWGPGIDFTYGPWGYLDVPLAIDRFDLFTGLVFGMACLVVGWFALRATLRRLIGADRAAIAATVILVLTIPVAGATSVLVLGLTLAALEYVGRTDAPSTPWLPAFTAACAGLAIQIKFNEGVMLSLLALLVCVFAPRAALRRSAESIAAYLIVFVVTWVAAHQSLGNVYQWLSNTISIARSYPEAQGQDYQPKVLSYLVILIVLATIVVYIVKMAPNHTRRQTVGVALVCLVIAYLAFKEGTDRHDPDHEVFFYFWTLPMLIWFVALSTSRVFRYTMVVLAVTFAFNGFSVSPDSARKRLTPAVEALASAGGQNTLLQTAADKAKNTYNVSPEIVTAMDGHPVSIDGYDVTVAFAYDLDWNAPPIFQSYLAFNARLDQLNTSWLASSPANQLILRPTVTSNDSRNSLWDPPRYEVAEMCNWQVADVSSNWILLDKGADRCAAPVQLSSVHVGAGEVIKVPAGAGDQLVTASFDADQLSLKTRVISLLDKPLSSLKATVDDDTYRLPRGLADGPLIMNVPSQVGWPAAFGGATSYKELSFTEAGTVTFSAIAVS